MDGPFLILCVQMLATKWTMGENVIENDYHARVVRNRLTRSLAGVFDDIVDEIALSFLDLIPAKNDGKSPIGSGHQSMN